MANVSLPDVEVLGSLITDAFYAVDSDDRIVVVNAAFRDMFEWAAPGTTRCRDVDFLPCHGGQCLRERCAVEETVQYREPKTVLWNARGETKIRSLTVTAGPVALPDGRPGTIIILRDVSDDVRLEAGYAQAVQNHRRRLSRYLELLKEMERRRREAIAQIVAGVAHELNTPLGMANAAAAGIVDRLESGELKKLAEAPAASEDLLMGTKLIQRNLLRVDELVRKLRKRSAGQMVDVREELDLGAATREALQLWKSEQRRANLTVDIVDRLTSGLLWDGYAGLLSQVVLELLSNVKMHAYPGEKSGRIEMILSSTAGSLPEFSVAVRDFGVGISPDVQAKIFEPFFTTARNKGAAGLGLSIAQHIVARSFGGALTCESRPGAGTIFSARFPHCPGSSHPAG